MTVIKPFNCHCITEGPGYSGGGYDNPYDMLDSCATGNCIDGVFATIYRMDFLYTNATHPTVRPCCPRYRQRYYNLYYTGSTGSGTGRKCNFATLELSGGSYTPEGTDCADGGPLATLVIAQTTDISTPYLFTVTIPFGGSVFSGTSPCTIRYSSNFSGSLPINCLSVITLPDTTTVFNRNEFNAGVCQNDGGTIPATITLTPV